MSFFPFTSGLRVLYGLRGLAMQTKVTRLIYHRCMKAEEVARFFNLVRSLCSYPPWCFVCSVATACSAALGVAAALSTYYGPRLRQKHTVAGGSCQLSAASVVA
jgi:hypothetical protein